MNLTIYNQHFAGNGKYRLKNYTNNFFPHSILTILG